MFSYKEHLMDYITKGHLHLSKKDYSFYSNLTQLIKNKKFVTTNQAKLFDKLLCKYTRQFKKLGFEVDQLVKLSWKSEIRNTTEEFLIPYIFFNDDKLFLKAPFNNSFIAHFRKIPDNTFIWDKNEKYYVSDYSTYSLKILHDSLYKFFNQVKIDDYVNSLLDSIKEYNNYNFNPILVKINNNFYVLSSNEQIEEQLKNIELNDDPMTLFKLSLLGVQIHPTIVNSDEFKLFASNFEVSFDLDKIHSLAKYLNELGMSQVIFGRGISFNRDLSKEIKGTLLKYDIECYPPYTQTTNENVALIKMQSSSEYIQDTNIVKCITLINSRPINVR
jgi:hypothetical protein